MRDINKKIIFFFTSFTLLFLLISVSGVLADVNECWDYDESEVLCEANDDCQWREDPWGGWCERKDCWNFWDETACGNADNSSSSDFINKTCQWRSSDSSGWCNQVNCWSLSGTNQSACESNAAGLSCVWEDEYEEGDFDSPCYGPYEKECWTYTTSETCEEVAGCNWGECVEEGCWDYEAQATCEAATGYNGNNCDWNSQYAYCYEMGCWDYDSRANCENNSCTWSDGYCHEKWCSDFSFTNQSACESNTADLNCEWDNGYCNEQGCWNFWDQNSCEAQLDECVWETHMSDGWCEEVRCWSFWDGDACENNSIGLNCQWDATWNNCYEDVSSKSCSEVTNERDCLDTFYCFWNYTGANCEEPSGIQSDFNEWNPKCYVFDYNQTECEKVLGCSWVAGECESNASIEANGLGCNYVNDSSLCNSISVLSSCCAWQSGLCVEDRFTTSCWDQMEEPPEGAYYCEDYNSYTDQSLCEQIAGSPWFMPCNWDNSTERCEVKVDKIFEQDKENLIYIDNKQNCEFAGGKWVTESYCEGSVAVPTGRCEPKFDDEKNCDKACFACEYQSDGTNWTNVKKAKKACTGSKLGICEFIEDSGAENSFGNCKIKDKVKDIVSGNCDDECSVCTYMGDPISDTPENRPSYYCRNSEAGCKWIPDLDYATDESKGRCSSESEKTCEDRCDKCYSESNCVTYGAKEGDDELTTQCAWDSSFDLCKPQSGANELEICWDGLDNNYDDKIDCADSMCFSDSFCGGGFGGNQDCFGYNDETNCEDNSCVWIEESWDSWCDVPGANCWQHDGTNATYCEAQGCEWHGEGGGWCEEDWDNMEFDNCFAINNATACTGNCTWLEDEWCSELGGICDPTSADYSGEWYNCIQHDADGETVCESAGVADAEGDYPCEWYVEDCGEGGGWCEHKKFACWDYHDETNCTGNGNDEWCQWNTDEWGSWCGEKMTGEAVCWDKANQSSCSAAGCNWMAGWCDPPGFGGDFGGGKGMGMDCYVHDGNQTGCEGTSGCGWFEEHQPFCDVDFSADCHQYGYNQTVCEGDDRCYWNNGWCDMKISSCWNQNEGSCNSIAHCNWNENMCEPICFSTNESHCPNVLIDDSSTPACRWITGWCGGAMQAQHFKEMEGGEPIMLGDDIIEDTSPPEVDILGFGAKDMGGAYGFGIMAVSLQEAALCNNIKLNNGDIGSGNRSTDFYFYLDTDGNRTGNCALKHDTSAAGYEFYFTLEASMDNESGEVIDVYSAYRCLDGEFVITDIKVSGFKQLMCGEIGGGMVAIDKLDLEKYSSLYVAGNDIRVSVASANSSSNISVPSDTVSSGYLTPGTVDFDLDSFDVFKVGGNGSNFGSDIASKGFVEFDADCWTQAGCADYACYNHPYCVDNSYGVHAAGFEDSRVPKIKAITKELYPDSVLINYYTDKPANGTLFFYGNDSTCSTLNATIYDRGILSNNTLSHRLPHVAEIYDDVLGYVLDADTEYFFKIKVCDEGGKCGVSKCSSFVTETVDDCAFCNFVTRIKAPSGWSVEYDLNQDGSYEHVQGQVCGANAGMKTNYTNGLRANIKLSGSDNVTWLEFVNARLTKTGLSSKIRDIDETGDLVASTTTDADGDTVGYAGMLSETRDKIVNNLNPELCYIKIPGDGNCTELWHCDDDLDPCIDRTSEAVLNETGSDYCVWQIPYCEFSTWAGGQPDRGSDSPGGGSGGGGGGSIDPSCEPSWSCSAWEPEECPSNAMQTRECSDVNECGDESDKPKEIKYCKYSRKAAKKAESENTNDNRRASRITGSTVAVRGRNREVVPLMTGGILFILIASAIGLVIVRRKKKKWPLK